MRTPPTHTEAEAHLRQLLADNDMPQPDEVMHHPAEVVFLFHEKKLAVTVELTEDFPDNGGLRADTWGDEDHAGPTASFPTKQR